MNKFKIGKTFLSCLLVICNICMLTPSSQAQTGGLFETLEARIAGANAVFVGTVVGYIDKRGSPWKFTVRVEEVLKGYPGVRLRFANPTYMAEDSPKCEIWEKNQTPILFFMKDQVANDTPTQAWTYLRLGPPEIDNNDIGDRTSVFSMDFTVLKTVAEILARGREFANQSPENPPVVRFLIPHSVAAKIGYSFDGNDMSVPVVPALEPIALRLINCPASFLPKSNLGQGESIFLRGVGIDLLSHFKSAANIKLLKGFLEDTSIVTSHRATPDVVKREYWLRKAAYKALTKWGLDLPSIPLEAPNVHA